MGAYEVRDSKRVDPEGVGRILEKALLNREIKYR